jgi:hypothetical protein
LLDLYLRGLDHDVDDLDDVVARTEGVIASFIKELVRRAVLHAADTTPGAGPKGVRLGHVDLVEALDDLLEHSAPVLRSSLGANPRLAEDFDPETWESDAPSTVGGWTAFRWSGITAHDDP